MEGTRLGGFGNNLLHWHESGGLPRRSSFRGRTPFNVEIYIRSWEGVPCEFLIVDVGS